MDQQAMIDDLVRMLDAGAQEGVGHINVAIDASRPGGRKVQTGCPECSAATLASGVPTLHEGLDRQRTEP